jgi:hypothetical protein
VLRVTALRRSRQVHTSLYVMVHTSLYVMVHTSLYVMVHTSLYVFASPRLSLCVVSARTFIIECRGGGFVASIRVPRCRRVNANVYLVAGSLQQCDTVQAMFTNVSSCVRCCASASALSDWLGA